VPTDEKSGLQKQAPIATELYLMEVIFEYQEYTEHLLKASPIEQSKKWHGPLTWNGPRLENILKIGDN
jgi:hypothetical protein